jgi:hypothetical protein
MLEFQELFGDKLPGAQQFELQGPSFSHLQIASSIKLSLHGGQWFLGKANETNWYQTEFSNFWI